MKPFSMCTTWHSKVCVFCIFFSMALACLQCHGCPWVWMGKPAEVLLGEGAWWAGHSAVHRHLWLWLWVHGSERSSGDHTSHWQNLPHSHTGQIPQPWQPGLAFSSLHLSLCVSAPLPPSLLSLVHSLYCSLSLSLSVSVSALCLLLSLFLCLVLCLVLCLILCLVLTVAQLPALSVFLRVSLLLSLSPRVSMSCHVLCSVSLPFCFFHSLCFSVSLSVFLSVFLSMNKHLCHSFG